MSRDNPVPRCRTWNFSHTLYTSILPEATRGLHPTSTIDPFALIKSLFEKLFKEGPAPVFYIHLRVSRAAFDLCVSCGKTGAALPDLPFAGFIQARYAVGLSILQPWLDTTMVAVEACWGRPGRNINQKKYCLKHRKHYQTRLSDCWLARVMRGWCRCASLFGCFRSCLVRTHKLQP